MPAASDAVRGLWNTADQDIRRKQMAADAKEQAKQAALGPLAGSASTYSYGRSLMPRVQGDGSIAYTDGPLAWDANEETAFGGR